MFWKNKYRRKIWEKEEEDVRAAGVFSEEEVVDFLVEMCKNEEDRFQCFFCLCGEEASKKYNLPPAKTCFA